MVIDALAKEFDNKAYIGSLAEAAFWVGLRQDIFHSVTMRKVPRLLLRHAFIDRSILPEIENDRVRWANRCVVVCADILVFCFGNQETNAGERGAILLSLDYQSFLLAQSNPSGRMENFDNDSGIGQLWAGVQYEHPADGNSPFVLFGC